MVPNENRSSSSWMTIANVHVYLSYSNRHLLRRSLALVLEPSPPGGLSPRAVGPDRWRSFALRSGSPFCVCPRRPRRGASFTQAPPWSSQLTFGAVTRPPVGPGLGKFLPRCDQQPTRAGYFLAQVGGERIGGALKLQPDRGGHSLRGARLRR